MKRKNRKVYFIPLFTQLYSQCFHKFIQGIVENHTNFNASALFRKVFGIRQGLKVKFG